MSDRRIAVIGLALRLPGADTPEQYWHNTRAGVVNVRRFTEDDLAAAGTPPEKRNAADFVAVSGVLDDVDGFDADFFAMSGAEAQVTDPQHRLFLQTCHHALENAGYAGTSGSRVGVFAGHGYHLYPFATYLASNLTGDPGDWVSALQRTVGNSTDFMATRAAYRLGLTGPALNVQTGCSTGLVAVHLASQALLAGDTDVAVAGASAVHVPQVVGYRHVKGSFLSRTGVCRAFDADADGTVGGNGVAAVVLKRLDAALADRDTVHAVILGCGVNNDGDRKATYTAPSVAGQREAILRAYQVAGVSPHTIGYLEAHGTGTYKGDPIEFAAMTSAFRAHTDRVGFCALGSSKPNLGHLDACAGLAGLIKAVLVLRHAELPPLTNFRRVNPAIDLAASPFYVPDRVRPWPTGPLPRRAAVSALAVGGTNVHVVLEQAPERAALPPAARPTPGLLPLSARHPEALTQLASAVRDHIHAQPDTNLADLVATTALGRSHLRHRLVAYGDSPASLANALDTFLTNRGGGSAVQVVDGGPVTVAVPPLFVYSGQGTPYPSMARAFAEQFPVFRAVLDECERLYRGLGGGSLLDVLLRGDPIDDAEVWPTDVAQPALFAYQGALTALWRHLGVAPGLVAGHSVGEYAALHAAGALSLADGLRLTRRRGELMQHGTAPGGMVAVLGDHPLSDLLAACPGLELATVGPGNRVLAGPAAAVDRACGALQARGLRWHRLAVDRAFHSALLDPILPALRAELADVAFTPLQTPLVRGVDGTVLPVGQLIDADQLVAHTRQPVRFDQVLARIATTPAEAETSTGGAPILEIGPHPALSGLLRRGLPGRLVTCSARRGAELTALTRAFGELHVGGVAVDWAALLDGCGGGRTPLPAYPFQPRRHWTGPALVRPASAEQHSPVAELTAQLAALIEVQGALMTQLAALAGESVAGPCPGGTEEL